MTRGSCHLPDLKIDRPSMPDSYGLSSPDHEFTPLPWSWFTSRLEQARNYWICTTRANGAPHVTPVWGVWVKDMLYFGAGDQALKARNLALDPRISAHLESGDEVVILNGRVSVVTDHDEFEKVAAAYQAKYDIPLDSSDGSQVLFSVEHSVALGWLESDFPRTATRLTGFTVR